MQIGQAQVVRSNWYDRSPLPILQNSNGTYVAHALQTRISYTVPANRVFKLTSFFATIQRFTAAAPVNDAGIILSIYDTTPSSIGSEQLEFNSNTLEDMAILNPNIDILVPAGYEVRVQSVDLSTGGQLIMGCGIGGTVYDA